MFKRLKNGIVIEDSPIPKMLSIFISITAITLWPFIIIKEKGHERLITHERIHIHQQRELLIIPFYFLYVLFWIKNIYKFWGEENLSQKAYEWIPFEREAYSNDHDITYPLRREKFSWKNYM